MSFPTGWTKKCSLTINASQVSDADSANLSNFPVLLTEVNFPSTIFDNTQSAGQDLRFTSDEAGTTELAFEIVNWDTTNDKAEVWVKVPTVDYDDDTTFYVWYGNSGASAYAVDATYGRNNVWTEYAGVYHLNDVNDSKGSNNLTNNGTCTFAEGKIGNGVDLELGSASQFLSGSPLVTSGAVSMSGWIKVESTDTAYQAMFGQGIEDVVYSHYVFLNGANTIYSFKYVDGYNNTNIPSTTVTLNTGTWYYVTQVITGTIDKIYWNGGIIIDDSDTLGYNIPTTFRIGRGPESGYPWWFDGMIDEVKVRASALTAGWIATEYNNQSAPSTFVTEGTETDVGSTGISASKRSINC